MNSRTFLVLGLFFCSQMVHAEDSHASQFFEGLAEGIFGKAPKNSYLNFDIVNNYSEPIEVCTRRITAAMGGFYEHGFFNRLTIQPYSSTLKVKKSKGQKQKDDGSVKVQAVQKDNASDSSQKTTDDQKDSSVKAPAENAEAPESNKTYHHLEYYQALFIHLASGKPTDLMLKDVGVLVKDVVWYPDNPFFKQYFLQAIPGDTVTQYYHVYTGKRVVEGRLRYGPMVEMLGIYDSAATGPAAEGNISFDDQLDSLMFFNATDTDWLIKCEIDGSVYAQDTVESACFAQLLAPSDKTLAGAKISMLDSATKKVITSLQIPEMGPSIPGQDRSYTFELYQSGAKYFMGMQGLNYNSKDTPISEHVRNITPTNITFWYQGVADGSAQASGSLTPIDVPGLVWFVYVAGKKVMVQKVLPGSVFSTPLLRPLIQDVIGYVYFFYIQTTDDKEAQTFISDFVSGTIKAPFVEQYQIIINKEYAAADIQATSTTVGLSVQDLPGQQVIQQANKELSTELISQVMSGQLTMDNFILKDTQLLSKASGGKEPLQGYLIGMDVFFPSGVQSNTFYYQLAPSQMDWANFTKNVSRYIDTDKVQAANTDVTRFIQMIYQQYLVNQAAAETAFENFLKTYGLPEMLDDSGNLTKYGKNRLLSLLDGPVSFSYPPLLLSAVQSLFTSAPDGLPMPSVAAKAGASTQSNNTSTPLAQTNSSNVQKQSTLQKDTSVAKDLKKKSIKKK